MKNEIVVGKRLEKIGLHQTALQQTVEKGETIGINFSTESIKEQDKVHPKGLRV